jgi:hypothetical protein
LQIFFCYFTEEIELHITLRIGCAVAQKKAPMTNGNVGDKQMTKTADSMGAIAQIHVE